MPAGNGGLSSGRMRESLVFVSGGSSGIGQAMIRTLPFSPARVFDLSRRGTPGCETLRVDLSSIAAAVDTSVFDLILLPPDTAGDTLTLRVTGP